MPSGRRIETDATSGLDWTCAIAGIECNLCGDGNYQGVESCDDGRECANGTGCTTHADCAGIGDAKCRPRGGDGCAANCKLEPGWVCEGTACSSIRCGDGLVAGSEECDDGNGSGPDGCSSRCTIEDGYICPATGGACMETTCGDFVVGGDEECDDDMQCSGSGDNCAIDADCPDTETCGPRSNDGCNAFCQIETTCGDGVVGSGTAGAAEQCDDGGYCTDAPSVQCTTDGDCATGICDNLGAGGDGCSATCQWEIGWVCSGEPGATSTCEPLFQWVMVRPFRITNIDPQGVHYDPTTRSFVGYKSNTAKPPLELCLDGTMVEHPTSSSTGCLFRQGSTTCETLTTVAADALAHASDVPPWIYWPTSQARTFPVPTYGGLTAATYDALTNTWFVIDSDSLERVDVLPRLSGSANVIATVALTGNLAGASGLTVADDGNVYVTIDSGGSTTRHIRAFGRNASNIGFNFTTILRTWTVSPASSSNGVNGVNGTDFRAFDTTQSGLAFGQSSIPGALFSSTDIAGVAIGAPLLGNVGDSMESSTDGSGFIVCTENASEPCYLFAQVCDDDSDCTSGATCQTASGSNYCAAPGNARDDFSATTRLGSVEIDVLENDTRSMGTCRDSTFAVDSVTQPTLGDVDLDASSPGCTVAEPCVFYHAPVDGTCNFIDTFSYTVNLGGGETDTAKVRVTITCDCGNGDVDLGEECDDGNTASGDGCSSSCTTETNCGNGIIEGAEACDDGDNSSGDGCSWDCRVEGCGNGIFEENLSEECDDGNTVAGDGCREDCTLESCGDGILDSNEECDDGNNTNGDGCSYNTDPNLACRSEAVCGDGNQASSEECDDGDTINTNACRNDCTLPRCGDSVTSTGEDCDLGANNGQPGYTCAWNCRTTGCGNGRLDSSEVCDDGNLDNGDGCDSNCTLTGCGNGVVTTGETCDDSNIADGDGCSSEYLSETATCGNGIMAPSPAAAPGTASSRAAATAA